MRPFPLKPVKLMLMMTATAGLLFCCDRPAEGQGAGPFSTPEAEQVTARLLCDHAEIAPGQTFHVGVLLDITEGWHIYWRNPGDSGMSTAVHLTAADGFKVETVRYPLPILFEQPGDLQGIGYEKQTMFIAKVTAPAEWEPGRSFAIGAEVEWLACKDVCVPGGTKLKLTLPTAEQPKPTDAQMRKQFEHYLAQLPLGAEGLDSPVVAVVTVPERLVRGHRLEVNIAWRQPIKLEAFLPVPSAKQIVEQIAINNQDKRSRITFKLQTTGKADSDTMDGLAIFRDAKGNRRGVTIAINLPAGN